METVFPDTSQSPGLQQIFNVDFRHEKVKIRKRRTERQDSRSLLSLWRTERISGEVRKTFECLQLLAVIRNSATTFHSVLSADRRPALIQTDNSSKARGAI